MRTGALSDEAVRKACPEFFPMPMHARNMVQVSTENRSGLQIRRSKYVQPPPVPQNYYAMSNSMAKHMDSTNVSALMSRLNTTFADELSGPPPAAAQPRPATPPTPRAHRIGYVIHNIHDFQSSGSIQSKS